MKLVTNVNIERNKMEMYLTDVPSLTSKMIEILEFQGFNLKFEKLDNGLYEVWFGSRFQKMWSVGGATDNYNLLRIQILSMFDNLKENVWNEREQCYMDTFDMIEKHIPHNNKIWKKHIELKKLYGDDYYLKATKPHWVSKK